MVHSCPGLSKAARHVYMYDAWLLIDYASTLSDITQKPKRDIDELKQM